MAASTIVKAAKAASLRAALLHQSLAGALQTLDKSVLQEREQRLIILRTYNQLEQRKAERIRAVTSVTAVTLVTSTSKAGNKGKFASGGIDRNDPILEWSKLHQPAGLWE
jgi:hypothetical protein